jgi:hypothetical protein
MDILTNHWDNNLDRITDSNTGSGNSRSVPKISIGEFVETKNTNDEETSIVTPRFLWGR